MAASPYPTYDVLLDILRRLPGHDLAVSRCVCREWKSTVDAHGLLLPHVFPRDARATSTRPPGADGDDDDDSRYPFHRPLFWSAARWIGVKHHCNGLLLLLFYSFRAGDREACLVCNPATGRWLRLPTSPAAPWRFDLEGMYIAFDPAVSRHYEVFLLPTIDAPPVQKTTDESVEEEEKRVLVTQVFSARTGRWEAGVRAGAPPRRRRGDRGTAAEGRGARGVGVGRLLARRALRALQRRRARGAPACTDSSTTEGNTYDTVRLPGNDPCAAEAMCRVYQLPMGLVTASYTRVGCETAGGQLGWTLAHEANLSRLENTLYTRIVDHPTQWEVVLDARSRREFIPRRRSPSPEPEQSDNNSEESFCGEDDTDKLSVHSEDDDSTGTDDEYYSNSEGGDDDTSDEGEEEDAMTKPIHTAWDWDEDNFFDVAESHDPESGCGIRIVGFHPHRDDVLILSSGVKVCWRTTSVTPPGCST
uniref:F-box domain-containing protein n=1 Tax=Leersia perrieri TaxID=77586 RepID=A0A0D9W5C7_9ORYZ